MHENSGKELHVVFSIRTFSRLLWVRKICYFLTNWLASSSSAVLFLRKQWPYLLLLGCSWDITGISIWTYCSQMLEPQLLQTGQSEQQPLDLTLLSVGSEPIMTSMNALGWFHPPLWRRYIHGITHLRIANGNGKWTIFEHVQRLHHRTLCNIFLLLYNRSS